MMPSPRSLWRATPALAGLVALALVVLAPPARPDGRKHETWQWSGAVAPGKTLEVFGVNGEIQAVAGSGSEVRIVAEKTGRRHDPSEVRIEVVPSADGVTICAVYPGYGNACEPHDAHSSVHNNDVTVDFHVEVPHGVALRARTVNGGVDVRGLDSPVHANTVNGSCTIETRTSGEASTVNGSVTATLGRVRPDDELSFSTVNGSVTLNLPGDLDARFDGSTVNGGVSADFPVEVTGRWGPRQVHGTVGNGSARVHVSTVNGGIRLHRTL